MLEIDAGLTFDPLTQSFYLAIQLGENVINVELPARYLSDAVSAGMQELRMGSHVEVLSWVVGNLEEDARILEIGCGLNSTPILAQRDLVSVERKAGWAEKMRGEGFNIVPASPGNFNDFSLVFVDGEQKERASFIQQALDAGVPWVVWHDSELPQYYGYDTVRIPQEYAVRQYMHFIAEKATTVATKTGVALVDIKDHV